MNPLFLVEFFHTYVLMSCHVLQLGPEEKNSAGARADLDNSSTYFDTVDSMQRNGERSSSKSFSFCFLLPNLLVL